MANESHKELGLILQDFLEDQKSPSVVLDASFLQAHLEEVLLLVFSVLLAIAYLSVLDRDEVR